MLDFIIAGQAHWDLTWLETSDRFSQDGAQFYLQGLTVMCIGTRNFHQNSDFCILFFLLKILYVCFVPARNFFKKNAFVSQRFFFD